MSYVWLFAHQSLVAKKFPLYICHFTTRRRSFVLHEQPKQNKPGPCTNSVASSMSTYIHIHMYLHFHKGDLAKKYSSTRQWEQKPHSNNKNFKNNKTLIKKTKHEQIYRSSARAGFFTVTVQVPRQYYIVLGYYLYLCICCTISSHPN